MVLLLINFILAPHQPYQEKKTPFECGYHSFLAQNRTQFTISFFVFALLFLLFDLEIVMIYPYVVSSHFNEGYGFIVMITFVVVLTLGFVFELGKNALKVETKQENVLGNVIYKPYNFIDTSLQSGMAFNEYITSSRSSLVTCYTPYSFVKVNILNNIDPINWFISTFLSDVYISIPKDSITNIGHNLRCVFEVITVFVLTTEVATNVTTNISELDQIVHEVTRQSDQLSSLIDRFEDFQANHPFNVVYEQETIGIDTGPDVSEQQAQEWSERVNVINNVIHDRCHSIESMLDRVFDIESTIDDINYEHKYNDLLERYQSIISRYRHL